MMRAPRLRWFGLVLAVCALTAAAVGPALVAAPGAAGTPAPQAQDDAGPAARPAAAAGNAAPASSPSIDDDAAAATPGAPAADGDMLADAANSYAFLFPVANATLGSVVGRFGDPRDGGRRTHLGVDIAAPVGTPVLAPVAGTVERTGSGGAGGRVIWLREAGADRVYYFAHLNAVDVRAGQRVAAGARLGTVGVTGNAAGTVPHLHFAVYENRSVLDPWWFLAAAERLAGRPAEVERLAAATSMRTRLNGAAVRSAPGRGVTLAVLPRHQAVTVLARVDGHYRVRYRGREGYVADWLLEAP
jgi:murein DD-endopeptidase MepM/ murein hydrolase activator NlpD